MKRQIVVVRLYVPGEPWDRVSLDLITHVGAGRSGRSQDVRLGSHGTAVLLPGAGGLLLKVS